MQNKNKNKNKNGYTRQNFIKKISGGYTIIETMVSISIFIVIILAGMSALLNANVVHRKSQDLRSIIDSLSFVLEDISRNVRTGSTYKCFRKGVDSTPTPATVSASPTTRSCSDGFGIAFETDLGLAPFTDQWVYYISGGKIFKSTDGANTFTQMTSDEVVIDSISGFSVLGAEVPPGNLQQPFITIRFVGKITYKLGTSNSFETPFSLQTSASQRLTDI